MSHESSCSFTLESTYYYTQCHSPRANTGSAFFRFSQLTMHTIESIAVITYVYSYMGLSLDFKNAIERQLGTIYAIEPVPKRCRTLYKHGRLHV